MQTSTGGSENRVLEFACLLWLPGLHRVGQRRKVVHQPHHGAGVGNGRWQRVQLCCTCREGRQYTQVQLNKVWWKSVAIPDVRSDHCTNSMNWEELHGLQYKGRLAFNFRPLSTTDNVCSHMVHLIFVQSQSAHVSMPHRLPYWIVDWFCGWLFSHIAWKFTKRSQFVTHAMSSRCVHWLYSPTLVKLSEHLWAEGSCEVFW